MRMRQDFDAAAKAASMCAVPAKWSVGSAINSAKIPTNMSEHSFTTEHWDWSDFLEKYWRQKPGLFKRPFDGLLATPGECLQGLLNATKKGRNAEELLPRFSLDRVKTHFTQAYFPLIDDDSPRNYVKRLAGPENHEISLILDCFHEHAPASWQNTTRFCAELYRRIGIPSAGAILDLFLGNNSVSSISAHKDSQEVFTFIIEGEKRFLLWPFEVFKDHPKVNAAGEKVAIRLDDVDYRKYRDRATVLEAQVGDLLYWNTSTWHMIESDSDFSMTLGLGLYLHEENPLRFVQAGLETAFYDNQPLTDVAYAYQETGDQKENVMYSLRQMEKSLELEAVREEAAKEYLVWRSRFGFSQAPEPAIECALEEEASISVNPYNPVLHMSTPDNTLFLAFNGRTLETPHDPNIEKMLDHLNSGELLEVRKLVDEFSNPDTSNTHSLDASREGIKRILFVLYQYGAFDQL